MFAHASSWLQKAGPCPAATAARAHRGQPPQRLAVSGSSRYSRGFAADLSLVPLLAVGEVLLVGADELLHSAHVGAENRSCRVSKMVSMSTHLHILPTTWALLGHQNVLDLEKIQSFRSWFQGLAWGLHSGPHDLDFQHPPENIPPHHRFKNCQGISHTVM